MKYFRIIVLSVLVFCIVLSSFSQNWDQIIKICASDRQGEDNFGCAVAISGDYAIVGANYEDHDEFGESTLFETGSAYIFKNESGTWTEVQKIVASDRASEDWFGSAVDIEGDYAVVGAYKEDHDELGLNIVGGAGSAYIFKNESGTWTQVQKIVASDRFDHDYFGYSVAISGDYIVVGAANEDENALGGETMDYSGSAYVFYNNSGTWQEVQKIVASDRSANDYFGFAVDINGDHIIVGASYEDEDETGNNTINAAGSAYFFENDAGNWIETQKIVASDREELGWFGWSVAIDGNYAIVGAYHESKDSYGNNIMEESGAAYIYMENAGTWSEVTKVVASDRALGDRFGWDVAINEEYAVVGAYCSDFDEYGTDSLVNSGAAYIYKNDAGNWSEEQKIVSNDRAPADYFGISVDVFEDYIISGAQNEDHDQFGHFTYSNAGSSYVFYNCREINVRQELTDIPDGGDYDFGIIDYGESSDEIIFTIENTGFNELLLTGDPKIVISGADASAFNINQSSVVSPLSQGISTTFTIVFTPSSTDLHAAEISISNNDTDENPYDFTIFGSGGKLPQTIDDFEAITEKTYGDPPFVVSATASSGLNVIFTSSDENVATCGGINGSTITIVNAGTCQIIANQAGDEIYLPANEVSQTLVVNVKPIDIIVDPGQSKTYGDADPELTFTVVPSLVNGDSYSGNLTRIEGEEIGLYEILQGDLSVGSNYEITFYTDNFEIIAKPITVTVNPGQSKIYGESDPVYTYSVSPALVEGDSFTGALTRESGEDFGFYEILQGSLDLNSNYELNFVSDNFEIIKKIITVTVTGNQSKTYGISDPVLNYTYSPGLVLGDSFTGELIREDGEDVGLYEIYQGTLQLGPNYNFQFVGNYFEIIHKTITVIPMPNQYKMYGQVDPVIYYSFYPELIVGDDFSGELSRVAGEDVGYYAIELGSLNLGSNYNISFIPDVFEIKVQAIIVSVDEEQMKEYGEDDPDQFTYTVIGDLATGDFLTGHLIRETGEDVGNYPILQGSLALNSNYNLVFIGENFEITAKQITVIADPNQSKVFGDDDPPVFTYTVEGNLLPGNEFTGALSRNMGESVGTYQILIGNLSINSNYDIVYIADYFNITSKEITVIADESQSKIFGEQDPVFTYSVIGELEPGNYISGQLNRETGEDVGFYEIQQGSLTVTYNYSINFISADFEIIKANPQIIWENPADIYFGTALSDVQLNATANIDGTFEYNPENGTVLEIGNNQELHVIFMPEDNINYTNAEAIVYINVLLGSNSNEYKITQNVYPNPTTGLLFINCSDCKIEELTVNDITGKILVKADYFSDEIIIDLSMLPAGTYIIVIKTNRGVITEKVIKW